jgi:hypothetical protein
VIQVTFRLGYYALAAMIAAPLTILATVPSRAQTYGSSNPFHDCSGAWSSGYQRDGACRTAAARNGRHAYERWRDGSRAVWSGSSIDDSFPMRGLSSVHDFGR